MKPGLHPDYHHVVFQDRSTGDAFVTRSTATSTRTITANTRSRRSQSKAAAVDLVPVTIDGRRHLAPTRPLRAYERGYLTPE